MLRGGDGRRGLVFLGVAVVLAAVGVFLTLLPGGGDPEPAVGSPTSAASVPTTSNTGVAVPQGTPTPGNTGSFDVYAYLPVPKEQLAAAADVGRRFIETYATSRYDEDLASYTERLKAFTTAELGEVLARSVSSPAEVEQDRTEQKVSSGSARLKTLRSIDKDSVVFVITAVQQITRTSGPQHLEEDFAVTLIPVGSEWRVFDLQPAGDGQDGDTSGAQDGAQDGAAE